MMDDRRFFEEFGTFEKALAWSNEGKGLRAKLLVYLYDGYLEVFEIAKKGLHALNPAQFIEDLEGRLQQKLIEPQISLTLSAFATRIADGHGWQLDAVRLRGLPWGELLNLGHSAQGINKACSALAEKDLIDQSREEKENGLEELSFNPARHYKPSTREHFLGLPQQLREEVLGSFVRHFSRGSSQTEHEKAQPPNRIKLNPWGAVVAYNLKAQFKIEPDL